MRFEKMKTKIEIGCHIVETDTLCDFQMYGSYCRKKGA